MCLVVLSFISPCFAQVTTLDLQTHYVLWDPHRERLLASVLANDPKWSKSVVIIDPRSGSIEDAIPIGNQPDVLALSDDGQFLYVGLSGLAVVQRYRMSDRSLDLEVPLGRSPDGFPWSAATIVPLPGRPDSIVVARITNWPRDGGVVVFDGAAARPKTVDQPIRFLYWAPDGQLYGLGNNRSFWLHVDPSGVSLTRSGQAFLSEVSPYHWLPHAVAGFLVVDSFCRVFDLQRGAHVGQLSTPENVGRCTPLPDPSGKSIYAVVAGALRRYSAATFLPEAELVIRASQPLTMIRWGKDGLLIRAERELLFTSENALAELPATPLPEPRRGPDGVALLNLQTNGLAYDSRRGVLYASVPGRGGSFGNSVISIDPASGTPSSPVFIGSEPAQLVLSDDGRRLFAALQGAPAVARLNLESGALEPSFSVLDDTSAPQNQVYWRALEMVALPRESDSVAVLQSFGLYDRSVVVYDRGVPRPKRIVQRTGDGAGDRLTAGDLPNTLLTLTGAFAPPPLYRLLIDGDGIAIDKQLNTIVGSFYGYIIVENGRIFTSDGDVWTSDTETLIATFAVAGLPLPDGANNRIYYVGITNQGHALLVGFELTTFRPVTYGLVRNAGRVHSLVWAGPNVIAFQTIRDVVLFPTTALQPWPVADLSFREVAPGVRSMGLAARDLAVQPATGKLLVSTPSTLGSYGNSILTLDPASGAVESAVWMGSEPSRLAVSGDGTSVYAWLAGEARVGRLNLASQQRDLVFVADFAGGNTQYLVWDLAGVPRSRAVAVSYYGPPVALFDEGKLRTADVKLNDVNSLGARYQIVFDDARGKLYGYNQRSSSQLKRWSVLPDGIRPLSVAYSLITAGGTQIRFAGGLIYSSIGQVIDPERSRRVAEFRHPNLDHDPNHVISRSKRVWPDPARGRVYFLVPFKLLVFDIRTYELLGSLDLPPIRGEFSSLVKWGEDGLAFHTSEGELYLVQISAIPLLPAPVPSPQKKLPETPGVRVLDLHAVDLAYDSRRNLIYASTPNSEAALGDMIAAIDPDRLQLVRSMPAGRNPQRLALSEGQQYLYFSVGLPNLFAFVPFKVRRLDLSTGIAGPDFVDVDLSADYPPTIQDLTKVPGAPESVAVLQGSFGSLRIYDDTVPRPRGIPNWNFCASVQPSSSPNRLYCYNNANTGFQFSRLSVNSEGVSILDSSGPDLIGEPRGTILYADGLIYTTNGRIIDPEAMREVGRVPARGLVAVDGNRIYFLEEPKQALPDLPIVALLRVFDRNSLAPLGSKEINLAAREASSLIPCGRGRLAFRSGQQIYIVDPF